jgi:histone arginine demethylase JMJD6
MITQAENRASEKNMMFEIERRAQLSYEEFAKGYLNPRKPVIITDALRGWKALERWTPEFFKQQFGDMKLTLQKAPTMAQLIDRVLESTEEKPAPYLTNQPVYQMFPSLKADLEPMPDYFFPNWLGDQYLLKSFGAKMNRSGAIELYIGGKGGSFPVLHYDWGGTHAFLMQIYGRKQFVIFSPDQEPFLYPTQTKDGRSLLNSVEKPDLEKFPLFAKAQPTTFVLEPGEMLFIPAQWWHTTKMLTPSISVSANVVNSSNWQDLTKWVTARRGNPLVSYGTRLYLSGAGAMKSWRDRNGTQRRDHTQ